MVSKIDWLYAKVDEPISIENACNLADAAISFGTCATSGFDSYPPTSAFGLQLTEELEPALEALRTRAEQRLRAWFQALEVDDKVCALNYLGHRAELLKLGPGPRLSTVRTTIDYNVEVLRCAGSGEPLDLPVGPSDELLVFEGAGSTAALVDHPCFIGFDVTEASASLVRAADGTLCCRLALDTSRPLLSEEERRLRGEISRGLWDSAWAANMTWSWRKLPSSWAADDEPAFLIGAVRPRDRSSSRGVLQTLWRMWPRRK